MFSTHILLIKFLELFGIHYIIRKSQMDRIPNRNCTIWSQLFEYRIIQIIWSNSDPDLVQ